jgi:hypothetical protein
MEYLNEQMRQWSSRLRDDLEILPPASNRLASAISVEVAGLSGEAKQRIRDTSPIPLEARIEELQAFQGWMDLVRQSEPHPVVVRAQVITQNYICFVYLGEACFKVLGKELPSDSVSKKCCKFLTDNPVRAFRNAIAHSNWRYLPDFSGLEFWARKGNAQDEPLARFTALQQDLAFWQAVARCTAYSSFLSL